MTYSIILDDNNIKDFGKLSSHSRVFCYQYSIYIGSKSIPSCVDRICIQRGIDHSYTCSLEDALASIDMLPEIFPALFKDDSKVNASLSANYGSL